MRIIDNFMNEMDFANLRGYLMGADGSIMNNQRAFWMASPIVGEDFYTGTDLADNFQMVHFFTNEEMQLFKFKDYIGYLYLERCKANLTMRVAVQESSSMHIDIAHYYPGDENNKNLPDNYELTDNGTHIPMKTAVLYLNTCDGYTEFEDGTRVESVANRFVEFDRTMKHGGVNTTNVPVRGVINFNYIPFKYFPRLNEYREEYNT